ncbi:hypothetical protein IE53DRAFT_26836 [Violaceomyces palustris]|uniref:Uncharacterized protein n=1 Tax=Violaceomyces palustris TaxID=1673888 RepID=A0ACD0P1P9_9BASI|nr:hypothetical protein IE53DRAFT_26836 [Violaceomyces palustris]
MKKWPLHQNAERKHQERKDAKGKKRKNTKWESRMPRSQDLGSAFQVLTNPLDRHSERRKEEEPTTIPSSLEWVERWSSY